MRLSTDEILRGGPFESGELRRWLVAGRAEVHLVGAGLGEVRLLGCEVPALSALYVAVRDADWGTVPGFVEHFMIDESQSGFTVRLEVRHERDDVAFSWSGELSGHTVDEDRSTISFSMRGEAERDFLANRIGFCLLHPLALSGCDVELTSIDGRRRSCFPSEISALQPFGDLTDIEYPLGEAGRCAIHLSGDLFETEDQRNWTDASFKTYSTPLHVPHPRVLRRGDEVFQKVSLVLESVSPATLSHRCRRTRRPPIAEVTVGGLSTGLLPPIGMQHTTGGDEPDASSLELLRRCRIDHVRVLTDLARPAWTDLIAAARTASRLSATLEITAVADEPAELELLVSQINELKQPVARMLVFERRSSVTTRSLAVAFRRATLRGGTRVERVVGGSRANFAELNRAELPLDLLDEVAVAINPQVHAFDDESVMSTLAVQPTVVANALRLAGGRPVIVGPVTLRPGFNAVARPNAGPASDPHGLVDRRQASMFAAAWTLGSIAALARSGASALTYHALAGDLGIVAGDVCRDDAVPRHRLSVYPLFHVFAEFGAAADRRIRRVRVTEPSAVAAIALGGGDPPPLALANLTARPAAVEVGPGFDRARVHLRRLDETAARGGLEAGRVQLVENEQEGLGQLVLDPYEVVFVRAAVETTASHRVHGR